MKQAVLENDHLRLVALPELGGKLISIFTLGQGREHLLQPPEFERRPAEYGAAFDKYDTSGFDECFPTVGACRLDDGTSLPDHGELWPVAWEITEQSSTSLAMQARGTAFPYVFRRRVSLQGQDVLIDYEVENQGSQPFPYLWSAHPLLQVQPGDSIVLPPEVGTLQVFWSAGDRVAGSVAWPGDLAELGDPKRGWAEKLFSGALSEGWATLAYSDGASLTFRFDTEAAAYLGLWICQGGWPVEAKRPGHFTLALEPCTAPVDGLDQALGGGYAKQLQPGQRAQWRMTVELRPGLEGQTTTEQVLDKRVGQ